MLKQPYEINPECHYRIEPLSPDEIRRVQFLYLTTLLPVIFISGFAFILTLFVALYSAFDSPYEYLLIPLCLVIFIAAIGQLFSKRTEKEVFESELTEYFGVYSAKQLRFKDSIGGMSSYYRIPIKTIKVGARYRVQKIKGRDVILTIEAI